MHGDCDSRGGGRNNHSMDYYWDLLGKPTGSANQTFSQDDSTPAFGSATFFIVIQKTELISILRDEYAQLLVH